MALQVSITKRFMCYFAEKQINLPLSIKTWNFDSDYDITVTRMKLL